AAAPGACLPTRRSSDVSCSGAGGHGAGAAGAASPEAGGATGSAGASVGAAGESVGSICVSAGVAGGALGGSSCAPPATPADPQIDRKSTRLNFSHVSNT